MHWSTLFFYNSGSDVTHNRVPIYIAHYVSLEDGVKHKLNPTQNLPLASTCIKAVLPPGGSVNSFRSWRGVRFPPRPRGIGPSHTDESKILTTRKLQLSQLHFGARRLQIFFSSWKTWKAILSISGRALAWQLDFASRMLQVPRRIASISA